MSFRIKTFFWILKVICVEEAVIKREGVYLTDKLPPTGMQPSYIKDGCRFYEIKTEQHNKKPNTVEFLDYVFAQEKISFVIDEKIINLYPLKHIEIIKNGKTKILGYFQKISLSDGGVFIKYSNGDSTVFGKNHSALVKLSFDKTNSYQQHIASSPNKSSFEITLNSPIIKYETTDIAIQCDHPTIGTQLVSMLGTELKEPAKPKPHFKLETPYNIKRTVHPNGTIEFSIIKSSDRNNKISKIIVYNDEVDTTENINKEEAEAQGGLEEAAITEVVGIKYESAETKEGLEEVIVAETGEINNEDDQTAVLEQKNSAENVIQNSVDPQTIKNFIDEIRKSIEHAKEKEELNRVEQKINNSDGEESPVDHQVAKKLDDEIYNRREMSEEKDREVEQQFNNEENSKSHVDPEIINKSTKEPQNLLEGASVAEILVEYEINVENQVEDFNTEVQEIENIIENKEQQEEDNEQL